MSVTPSTMLPLGTLAPPFRLPDTRGEQVSIDDFGEAAGLLVMFICNHCPFVKHVRGEIARMGRDFQEQGLAVVAINANDVESHPADGPAEMAREVERAGYTFPYLFDETQDVAKAYRAACTPEFYLFDRDRRLVYRGQMDGSRPGNDVPVSGRDLRDAVQRLLDGVPIPEEQRASAGCNIKWKPGNAPDYF